MAPIYREALEALEALEAFRYVNYQPATQIDSAITLNQHMDST